MTTPAWAVTMARYNDWMNRRLYALCAGIGDAERRRDRGQVTTLLSQMGLDVGSTDLPFMPGIAAGPADAAGGATAG